MRAKLDQIGQNYCNSTSVSLFVVCFAFAGCRSRFCLWLNEILKPAAYSARLCSSLALTSQAGRQAYRQEEDGDQITNCGDSCQSSINLKLIKSVNKTSSWFTLTLVEGLTRLNSILISLVYLQSIKKSHKSCYSLQSTNTMIIEVSLLDSVPVYVSCI